MIHVRRSATFIADHATFVRIDELAIRRVANLIVSNRCARPTETEMRPFHSRSLEEIAMWCFILDSVNFCFWADRDSNKWSVSVSGRTRYDGYWALVAALKRGSNEVPLFDPRWLSELTLDSVRHLFRGSGEIPLIEKRREALRELGRGLLKSKKSAWELVQHAHGDVVEFIDQILKWFPLYRDEARYHGRRIGIYKRAQILCQDLSLELSLVDIRPFTNLEKLTAFADYKIPQLLRELCALRYSPTLARLVDTMQEFKAGSPEEIEIRGSTIHAIELLRLDLAAHGVDISSADLDNLLWTEAVGRGSLMKPHHRVRTTNY